MAAFDKYGQPDWQSIRDAAGGIAFSSARLFNQMGRQGCTLTEIRAAAQYLAGQIEASANICICKRNAKELE